MRLLIPRPLRSAIEDHAVREYPREACGFLLGLQRSDAFQVARILLASNRESEDPLHRYRIDRRDYERAEALASSGRHVILGIYHSHPDAPPEPSEIDSGSAFPEWIYWITPVAAGRAGPPRAWLRSGDMESWLEIQVVL